MVVTVDSLFYAERKRIAGLALAGRLPTIVYSNETLEVGALISAGANLRRCVPIHRVITDELGAVTGT